MFNISRLMVLFFVVLFSFISCNKDSKIVKDIYNCWEIVDFMSVESVAYPKNNDYNPIIQFYKEGNYTLDLDVNGCSGEFNLTGEGEIEITLAGCTKLCCDSDFSKKIQEMLSQVSSYSIERNKLPIYFY